MAQLGKAKEETTAAFLCWVVRTVLGDLASQKIVGPQDENGLDKESRPKDLG